MDKIVKFQQAMPASMEAAVFSDPANRFYLTGMKSSAGTVLVTKRRAWLIIDFRYLEMAEKRVKNCIVVEENRQHGGGLYEQIWELLAQEGITRLFVHAEAMSHGAYMRMKEALSGINVDGGGALSELMDILRSQKDEEEVACHRKAQEITDIAFDHVCGYIKPGVTEIDIAREIGVKMAALGSEDRHFNFIVASGPNSALPHGVATSRVVKKGDFITMDFGAVYGGYMADMTRTVVLGSATDEQRKVYETVKEAQKRAFAQIRPGAVCGDVDAAARDYIYEEGYEGCFSHGLGHSLGVEIHEQPRFREGSTQVLTPGVVITVEPGIYLKGRFGVRIEDMVVVREDGFENLTRSPKELILL